MVKDLIELSWKVSLLISLIDVGIILISYVFNEQCCSVICPKDNLIDTEQMNKRFTDNNIEATQFNLYCFCIPKT